MYNWYKIREIMFFHAAPAAYERSVRVCNDCKSTLETVMREVQSRDTIIVL